MTTPTDAGRPLGIAHVVVSLEMGGAERMVVDTARLQAARGHRVAVYALSPSVNPILRDLLGAAGIPVEELERGGGIDVRLVRRLAAAFRARRPDVVHTHNEPPLIYATPAARLLGVTAIHTCHGPRHLSRGAALLGWGGARLTGRYVAVTASLVDSLASSGDVPRAKLRVIENGVNTDRFQPTAAERAAVRAELGIAEGAFVVGSVGRLAPEKNYGFLIQALEPLLASGAHLIFVGDGRERAGLERQAAATSRPSAIHFVGAQAEVARFHAAMDVFSLTSTFEGLPIALLEAMASSRPVVASAVGGIPLVVEDGATGFLVPPGDVPGFTAALDRVRKDAALAARLGATGRTRVVARYGLGRMVDEYVALYRELKA
jgi:glycosyltransferase involved in cell wall biosynthesis